MTSITTERLTLTNYHPSNSHRLKLMVEWLNDPEVVRFSEQRHRKHDEESQQQYLMEGPDVFREIHIGHGNYRFIGTISAYIDRPNSVADVGILIGEKSEWGKGYGFEAWEAFCNHLLNNGIRKIEAGCMSRNRGMIQIFDKYDMTREGSRYSHFLISPEETSDMQMWGKFA